MYGHTPICLGHLSHPQELDSYMYQTVASEVLPMIAKCLDLPIIIRPIKGKPKAVDMAYETTPEDETEDLFELLKEAKENYDLQAVCKNLI